MARPSFAQGDVVCFDRGILRHLALYVGNNQVVHVWSTNSSDFQVRVDSIRYVQQAVNGHKPSINCSDGLDRIMLACYALRPFAGNEIVRRAMSRVGKKEYHWLSSNCEHFVTWARYGYEASPQITAKVFQALVGAACGASLCGFAGSIVGALFPLLCKDLLTVSCSSRNTASCTSIATSFTKLENHAREYTSERHEALASRLAEDNIQCGICYSNLLHKRAVVFSCDHVTCDTCYALFEVSLEGEKLCPFCRESITDAQKIHRSTKLRAKNMLGEIVE